MNFIWDIVLRARESGYQEEDLFFVQAADYSPYYEQSFSVLNQDTVEKKEIELNALFRFSHIFQEILKKDVNEFEEFQKYLFDTAVHILLYADLHYGISKRELYIRKFTKEILNGIFGEDAAQNFQMTDAHEQNRLAALVLTQVQTGSSLIIFRKAVLVLYPNAMLYQIRADKKTLLLYVEVKKSAEREQALNFVLEMFLPLCYELRVFWGYHFGVIGVESTMIMDEIEIY